MRATRVCRWQLHFSGGKKRRPEEWHGNKLCSNTTQKRGKRVSKPERAGYEFRLCARMPQGLTQAWSWHSGHVEGDAKRQGYSYSRGALSKRPPSRDPIIP